MSVDLTPEQMQAYRAAVRARRAAERAALAERRQRAWVLARQAAELLKTRFGATRVVVFGSLNCPEFFNEHSDVDIAAWGLPAKDWLRAIGAVQDLSDDIPINLVDMNIVRPELAAVIEREGVEL
jgi:predicted nucleotidyltransferase